MTITKQYLNGTPGQVRETVQIDVRELIEIAADYVAKHVPGAVTVSVEMNVSVTKLVETVTTGNTSEAE